MANPEHVAILKQGVLNWNTWRAEHPETKGDLSGAILEGWELRPAVNFTGTNLSRADLRRADLVGAQLMEANLSDADLYKAHLSSAT